MKILTTRMRLVAATVELACAELENRSRFDTLLNAAVPDNWPPEMIADALPWFRQRLEAAPELAGWLSWYGILGDTEPQTLAASAGFLGPPKAGIIEVPKMGDPQEGTVEMGYSVLPQFQGRGYGTEMVGALAAWALAQPGVRRILTDVSPDNIPSVRLLRRLGFREIGRADNSSRIMFEKTAT